ncbi:hypothetical protein ACT3TB_19305 [Micrococcaceae sp. AOP34-BR2-30]
MKKSVLAILMLPMIGLTACGADNVPEGSERTKGDVKAWFSENCPAQVSPLYGNVDWEGEPQGESFGQVLSQGAIRPPGELEEGVGPIGMFSYDEVAGTMTHTEDVSSNDLFCMERAILEDGWKSVRKTQVEGHVNADDIDVSFARLRSPEHPEGVWVEYDLTAMGWSIDKERPVCPNEWTPATDITPAEGAAEDDRPFLTKYQGPECRI